jgi:hypothetical protein
MDDHNFFDNSDRATQPYVRKIAQPKYPWKEVPIGKSFAVQKSNISLKTLRSLASKTGKDLGKKFRVIDHDGDVYEVACLPMEEKEAIATSSNLIQALDKIENNKKSEATKKALEDHIAKMAAMGVHMPKIGND